MVDAMALVYARQASIGAAKLLPKGIGTHELVPGPISGPGAGGRRR